MTGEEDLVARRKEVFHTLNVLIEFWALHPELRLGQIIENARVISDAGDPIYYIDDRDLVRGIRALEEHYVASTLGRGTE